MSPYRRSNHPIGRVRDGDVLFTVSSICREYGSSETTFYRWCCVYGGMPVNEAAHLRERERKNSRLKRLLVEGDLEVDALKELLKNWLCGTGRVKRIDSLAGFNLLLD